MSCFVDHVTVLFPMMQIAKILCVEEKQQSSAKLTSFLLSE